jgi:hypothetical protein
MIFQMYLGLLFLILLTYLHYPQEAQWAWFEARIKAK